MKIVFAGTPEFAAGHLQALISSTHEVVAVITQPDRPGKRGKKLVPSPVKQVASEADIQCLQPARLNTETLEGIDFELLVVVAYGQILRPAVLEYPLHGCINVHASLLPRWRGAAPVQRAILAGDRTTGVTIIQMDEGLDTGDMLATRVIDISSDETTGSLLTKMLVAGQSSLLEVIDDIACGETQPVVQDDNLSTYAGKIEKGEAQIDWDQPAEIVSRKVRAFQPDPAAFTFLDSRRVKIHSGKISEGHGPAGQILKVDDAGILVACGTDAFLITSIQLPMGKGSILSPKDVMNGWTSVLAPGATLKSALDSHKT